MSVTNRDIYEYAMALGLGDIRFADAHGLIPATNGAEVTFDSLLEQAKTLLVLFAGYLPAREAAKGNMALSPYYIASNNAYSAAKLLTAFLKDNGASALHVTSVSARAAALRTGGFIGDNGFYYHDTLGSFTCIQAIITGCAEPEVYNQNGSCLHCGKCKNGCPSNAVGNIDDCLRKHMHGVIPERLRAGVYQLLGCEKCQTACPLNSTERSQPHEFGIKSLLCGESAAQLKELAGANMARSRRIISQAALYAANTKAYDVLDILKQLSQSAEEPVSTHALWAYNKLGETDDNA